MFKYNAFISYSQNDLRVAAQLQRYLKLRKIPKSFRKEKHLSEKSTFKVFRDDSDLSIGPTLSNTIKNELENSEYLILICSPYAVNSSYVEQEIIYFKSLGRTNNILCVIAGGDPNTPDNIPKSQFLQCFPRPIRFRVDQFGNITNEKISKFELPLAADLRGQSETLPRLQAERVVAGLLGVSLSDLRNAENHDKRKKIFICGIFISFVFFVSFFIWDSFFRIHVDYYRNYVRRWGIWQGVDPVKIENSKRINRIFRFTRYGRKNNPDHVDLINGSGGRPKEPMKSLLGNYLSVNRR